MQLPRVPFACLVMLLIAVPSAHAQSSFDAARDLYASADYETALTMLDDLSARPHRAGHDVDLYRALCLFALGRGEDAARAVEAIVLRDPLYQVPDDVAPRMRTAFGEIKKRLLPAIVQQHYQSAKAAFDDKNFAVAADSFQLVLDALADPSLSPAASQPPLSDMQVLATGFRELSVKAIPPPPPAAFVAVPPAVVPLRLRIYNGTEAGVVPPVAITQEFPKFPGRVPPAGIAGTVEVVIDQTGAVEWASMQTPILSGYDDIVVAAARNWRYQPARMNGTPVKFHKQIQIKVVPERAAK